MKAITQIRVMIIGRGIFPLGAFIVLGGDGAKLMRERERESGVIIGGIKE